MCKCDPNKRTPYCGAPGCEWPETESKFENKIESAGNIPNLPTINTQTQPAPLNIDEVVTGIRIEINENSNYPNLLAKVTIKIYGMFLLKGLRIMKGREGKFLAMPAVKDSWDKWRDVFYPMTNEARQKLTEKILKQYDLEYIPF